MDIRIDSIHFVADEKLTRKIETKVAKFEKYFDRIISIDVKLKLEGSQKVKEKIVELIANVPGDRLLTKRTSKSFEVALDLAIKSMKSQIMQYKEKLYEHK